MSPQKIVIHCQDGPYCTIEVHLPEKSYYASMESVAVRTAPSKPPPSPAGCPIRFSRDSSSVSVSSAASYQIEKKQQPTFVTSTKIFRPAVKRRSCKRFDLGDDDLPLSILLTGGLKLRKAGLTGKGIRVGVIDSGIDRDHPGFNGKVTKQMWFRYGTPLEMDDHGTHVAGVSRCCCCCFCARYPINLLLTNFVRYIIIKTIHMMAPDAEIYDYRVFGEDGGIGVEDAIMIAIYEAVFDGCNVINMSLGGRWPSSNIHSAVQFAESKDVIVVCAAGNEGDNNPLTNERRYVLNY
jgi:subtilisin family serine protease